MREHEVDFWEVVKLDCEGAEYEILEEWPGPVARQITVEFHDRLGRNPEAEPERYYARLMERIGHWYDVILHRQTRPPWGGLPTYWDSLFVLKQGLRSEGH